MAIFISINMFALFLGVVFSRIDSEDARKKYLFLVFVVLASLYAFRDADVGIDTPSYIQMFNEIAELPFSKLRTYYLRSSNIEIGFCIFNKIVSMFTRNVQIYFLCIATIIFSSVAFFIYVNSDNVYMATYLFICYYYLEMFNLTRQYMALCFLLCSYCFIKKKHLFISIVWYLLAISFHTTAVVFLVVYIVYYLRPDKAKIVLASIIAFAVYLEYDKIMYLATMIIPRYAKYTGSTFLSSSENRGTILYINIFLSLGCYGLCYIYNLSKNKMKDREIYLYLILFIIATSIGFVSQKMWLLFRIYYYFHIFVVLLLPNIIERMKKYKVAVYLLLVPCISLLYYVGLKSGKAGVIPYHFFH